jgi:FkbM family methyltransferase
MSQNTLHRMKIAMLRAGVLYAPSLSLRSLLWHRWIEPELAWRDHAFIAKTQAGVIGGNTRDILQQYLYYFGIWEPELTTVLKSRLKPGDNFIDVGANIGYFSLLAANQVGQNGKVIAIEASAPVYQRLVENVARNRLSQVRTLHIAAAGRPGRVKLYCDQSCNCGATSIVQNASEVEVAEVNASPISDLVSDQEWANARLVKIDVEGAEADVVQGFRTMIDRDRPDREYLIEVHPVMLAKLNKSVDDVLKPFFESGYHAYTIGNDYDPATYLQHATSPRPRRLDAVIENDTNLILSREEKNEL